MFVGIDVGKESLDVGFFPDKLGLKFKNDPEAIAALLEVLKPLAVELVVLEPSGNYELSVLLALQDAGIPVALVQPKRIRSFAKALGQIAKTDKVDAEVMARFAEKIRPQASILIEQERRELEYWVSRRRQIQDMLVAEQNRLSSCPSIKVKANIEQHIAYLKAQSAEIEKGLQEQVRSVPEWKNLFKMMKSITGIGNINAFTLLSQLPELGKINSKQLSALVGLAPYERQSGKYTGKKFISGGRAEVRNMLYMAAHSAAQHNPTIKSFFQRLISKGKPRNLCIVACARKLLGILNAMVKNQTVFDPTYQIKRQNLGA